MNRVVFPCAGALQQLAGWLAATCAGTQLFSLKVTLTCGLAILVGQAARKVSARRAGREGGSQRETLSEMYLCVPGP